MNGGALSALKIRQMCISWRGVGIIFFNCLGCVRETLTSTMKPSLWLGFCIIDAFNLRQRRRLCKQCIFLGVCHTPLRFYSVSSMGRHIGLPLHCRLPCLRSRLKQAMPADKFCAENGCCGCDVEGFGLPDAWNGE